MRSIPFMDRTRAGAICILICAAYAVAGLMPFDFITGNAVRWLSPGPGISLSGHAILRSSEPLDLSAAPGVTLECYLEPAEEPTRHIGVFLSLFDGLLPQNLILAQWRDDLILRTPVLDRRGQRRYRQMNGPDSLNKDARRFVAVTCGPNGTILYADGAPARGYPEMVVSPQTFRGGLIVGTGAHGGTDWEGTLFGLAILCRPLTVAELESHGELWRAGQGARLASDTSIAALYLFDQGSGRTVRDAAGRSAALQIPEIYRYPVKQVLLPPWDDRGFPLVHDMIINTIGFIPFGIFFFIYRDRAGRRASAALQTIAVSAAISLIIELLQVFLPSRTSSLTDVMCNTAGGLLGAALAALLWTETARG